MMVFIASFLLATATWISNPISALPIPKREPLPYFQQVDSWLARGGQPTKEGFEKLHGLGFRTVINFRVAKLRHIGLRAINNFRAEKWKNKKEKAIVEGLGMNYIELPWNIFFKLDPLLLEEYIRVLDTPSNHPIFIHCKHGRDRTGVMMVATLMYFQHLSLEEARHQAFQTVKPNLRYRWFVNKRITNVRDYFSASSTAVEQAT